MIYVTFAVRQVIWAKTCRYNYEQCYTARKDFMKWLNFQGSTRSLHLCIYRSIFNTSSAVHHWNDTQKHCIIALRILEKLSLLVGPLHEKFFFFCSVCVVSCSSFNKEEDSRSYSQQRQSEPCSTEDRWTQTGRDSSRLRDTCWSLLGVWTLHLSVL